MTQAFERVQALEKLPVKAFSSSIFENSIVYHIYSRFFRFMLGKQSSIRNEFPNLFDVLVLIL